MIEDEFDISYIGRMALREKQIQQNYRPIIAVHKWFARRPGALFRGLLLAEFVDSPVSVAFTQSNDLKNLHIADPFMGGGTPLIEANRLGCDVTGFDINPMAYWIVRQELAHLDLAAYREASEQLLAMLRCEVGNAYETRCTHCGSAVPVKYFMWVKQQGCADCGHDFDLWPGMILAKDSRHPRYVLVCRSCGELNEVPDPKQAGRCTQCQEALTADGNASRGKAACLRCGRLWRYPNGDAPPRHRLFAIEYHCSQCRPDHRGRFFKSPDEEDRRRALGTDQRLGRMRCRFVPNDRIPAGDETNRLHRWGYQAYRDMFNARQLVGLELSARFIDRVRDDRVRDALATNLSDLLRYQNMCCRYDTTALKSLDVFSVHGFPVSLIQCESNLLGITSRRGTNVGSGGWSNIVTKYAKAKEYCEHPFETVGKGSRKRIIFTHNEWIGDRSNGKLVRIIDLRCRDAAVEALEPDSLDAVLTDPPYFGNVQYAELMDFCYVWLKKLIGRNDPAFRSASTRNLAELTGNTTLGRGLDHFTDGLSRVFREMARALKPNSPLAFTYHHNKLSAYSAVGVAILDSELPCTATLPCPAEMSGSIHINGTGSSIVDTVFVCRKGASPADVPRDVLPSLVACLAEDIRGLAECGHKATEGDVNCLLNGHTTRLTVASLWADWSPDLPVQERLDRFGSAALRLADRDEVKHELNAKSADTAVPFSLFSSLGADC